MAKFLIIGGGVTGVTAAQRILSLDSKSDITLLSAEPYPYYFRPRLWEYIAGQTERPALFFRPPEWYTAQNICFRMGVRVVSIHPAEHMVASGDGGSLPYDRLLIATGARPFVPPIAGINLPGVFTLRSLDDAEAIRRYLPLCRRAVVVGGGLLGLETARAIASAGLQVTVLESRPRLLPRQLDAEGAQVLLACLARTGLQCITGVEPASVFGESSTAGVELADGRRFEGELVLFSTGVLPDAALAQAAGLKVHRGILVDDRLQTSAADIYAAGDAAEHGGIAYGLIQPGMDQARAAAANMAGGSASYHGTFAAASLKIAGVEVVSLGEAGGGEDQSTVLRRVSEPEGTYRKLVLRADGSLAGATLVNEKENALPLKQLIASRMDLSRYQQKLLDPAFDFPALAKCKPA